MNPIPATSKPEAPPARPGLVAFAGAGPGDEGLLTLRAAELLAQADLVVGRPELTGPLAHRLPERAAIAEPADPGTDAGRLIEAARAGQLAVCLFTGDPLLFSRASQQADACARARVRVEIVPGVSAATGVPAFAGIPLTADTGGLRVVHA
ncbi:MAG TPA: SAM-dependent methyltransferase, partial [Streptosporangiaceae bacterium]